VSNGGQAGYLPDPGRTRQRPVSPGPPGHVLILHIIPVYFRDASHPAYPAEIVVLDPTYILLSPNKFDLYIEINLSFFVYFVRMFIQGMLE
jgi:hypothetical protein